VVQTFAANRADDSFDHGILPRRPRARFSSTSPEWDWQPANRLRRNNKRNSIMRMPTLADDAGKSTFSGDYGFFATHRRSQLRQRQLIASEVAARIEN